MPAKSRHGKGKRHHQSKKSKAIQRHGTVMAPPAKAPTAAAPAPAPAPTPPKAVATAAKATTLQYPYIKGELKRIAILAVIILIVLFILSTIIS